MAENPEVHHGPKAEKIPALVGAERRNAEQPTDRIKKVIADAKTDPDRAMHELAGVSPHETRPKREKNEVSNAQRQQDKIIHAFLRAKDTTHPHDREGIYRYVLSNKEVHIEPQDRERYLQMVRGRKVGPEEYAHLLSTINKPREDPQSTEQRFRSMDRQMKGIVAYLEKGNFAERDGLQPRDLQSFSAGISVMDYDRQRESFLAEVEKYNGPQKRAEYAKAFARVGKEVFGKQWEYLNQIKALEAEAGPKVKEKYERKHDPRLHDVAVHRLPSQPHVEAPVTQTQLPQEKPKKSFWEKTKNAASNVGLGAKLASLMVTQAGGIHPARVNDRWVWVIEPWARLKDDPRQPPQGDNVYLDRYKALKEQGVKVVDGKYQPGGEIPRIRAKNGLDIQLLNHNRIRGAQANGMKIVVGLSDAETYN